MDGKDAFGPGERVVVVVWFNGFANGMGFVLQVVSRRYINLFLAVVLFRLR